MKTKRVLSLLLLCWFPLFSIAQLRITPPLIQYRQGNENLLDIRLSRSGVVLTPSSSLTISAEIRESEDTRVLLKLPFVRPDTSTRLRATLPVGLGSGIYKLGLLIQQTGYSDYRTGIANLKILASGSLESISASANLSVSILPQTAIPINITAESGPLLIAYYNQQAQAIRNHVDSVSVQVVASNGLALSNLYSFTQSQNQRDDQQDTQIGNRVLTATYTSFTASNATALAALASSIGTNTASLSAIASSVASFSTAQTSRDAGQDAATTSAQNTANTALSTANSATATGASNSTAIAANANAITTHASNTSNPHGTTAAQVGAYTTNQTNNLIANKPDDTPVATFAAAKLLIASGVKQTFTIANNELFGGTVSSPTPTHSKYDGTNWSHSPALFQNN